MTNNDNTKVIQFKWTRKSEKAALVLSQGFTEEYTAKEAGVSRSTIARWKKNVDFQAEVDRLSLMVDISSRAERLRIAMRAARQKVKGDYVLTEKDILDWLKFAQSETDGIKLDLAALAEAASSVAD